MASKNFNNMAPSVEDTIYYWLFPHNSKGEIITSSIELEDLVNSYLAHVAKYTHNYLWNKDQFMLSVKEACEGEDDSGPLPAHIGGQTTVGDLLDDEWFIVFLLNTLTKDYPGLVVRVVDSDGELMMIEAAQHLPSWANPDTAQNRVYLYQGHLHLIPLATSPSSLTPIPSGTPFVMDAVSTVVHLPSLTLASPDIQKAIALKIDGYNGKLSVENQHIAHAYVPVGVAALLREYPTLVAQSVHAFVERDPGDKKALRTMRHFPPETRVMTAVRLSKAMYARLAAHPYVPEPRTGWGLPPATSHKYKSYMLGMKLACGFEILMCNAGVSSPTSSINSSSSNSSSTSPESPTTEDGGSMSTSTSSSSLDLSTDPRWARYLQSLKEKGYFRGELEGSKLYCQLEDEAKKFFLSNVAPCWDNNSPGMIVKKLLKKVDADYEFFKEREGRLKPEDDDSWLEISPQELDNLLETRFGVGGKSGTSDAEVMDSLASFLSNTSDMDGAEVPDELQDRLRKMSTLSTRKMSGGRKVSTGRKVSNSNRKTSLLASHPQIRKISSQSNASDSSDMSTLSSKVDFNADSFTDALTNILDLGVPDDDYWEQSEDESSGLSSYGDENEGDVTLSRKSSAASNKSDHSAASSGVDTQLRDCMKEIEKELASTTVGETLAKDSDDEDDEFGDVEDFEPVKVDMRAVQDLVKTYTEQRGLPGPASSLLGSLNLPNNNNNKNQ
ncbi:ecdysoneless cell cycle regulator isoform X2 [Oratosquilla oratoria]